MILDRTWNKQTSTLNISYIDKQGNRQFYSKQFHHWKTYEYDKNGEFDTWNNKKCNKIYKDVSTGYNPNEFDILEFMYGLKDNPSTVDIYNNLHAFNFPKFYAFDIETKYIPGTFPEADLAEHEVTTISLVNDKFDSIVYGTKPLSEDGYAKLKERVHKYIQDNEYLRKITNGYETKVLYQKFDTEQDMLKHFFTVIVPKIAVLGGWNSYRFDWTYLVNRIKRLFGEREAMNMIKKASPTGELGVIGWAEQNGDKHKTKAPRHSIIVDYMELVKSYDYSLRPYESYSLDWVSSAAFNAHKIKYDGDLDQLYNKDYDWYVFYNAIDSILVQAIHHKLKCIENPCASSAITLVDLLGSLGQVALTTANIFQEFYNDNKHVVYNFDEIDRTRVPYEGAFCGCVPGPAAWCVCDDFASLYPSQIRTCNFSFENFVEKPRETYMAQKMNDKGELYEIELPLPGDNKWTQEELDKFRQDPNYFVSVMGNVYKNDKDYAFKRVQERLALERNKYKYTGQKIDAELLPEIDRLINEKKLMG